MHKTFSAFRIISLGLSEVKLLGQKAAMIFWKHLYQLMQFQSGHNRGSLNFILEHLKENQPPK